MSPDPRTEEPSSHQYPTKPEDIQLPQNKSFVIFGPGHSVDLAKIPGMIDEQDAHLIDYQPLGSQAEKLRAMTGQSKEANLKKFYAIPSEHLVEHAIDSAEHLARVLYVIETQLRTESLDFKLSQLERIFQKEGSSELHFESSDLEKDGFLEKVEAAIDNLQSSLAFIERQIIGANSFLIDHQVREKRRLWGQNSFDGLIVEGKQQNTAGKGATITELALRVGKRVRELNQKMQHIADRVDKIITKVQEALDKDKAQKKD